MSPQPKPAPDPAHLGPRLRLGVSRCLLGDEVRYDGQHKRDEFLVDVLGPYVEWLPVCPEVEIGLPIPRESLRLVGDPAAPRLVAPRAGADHTDRMRTWAAARLDGLAAEDLVGFVFKKDSPSSGLFRVKVYGAQGMPARTGSGIFARAFTERFPDLPVEEEGRLHDWRLRENFVERIFAVARWQGLLRDNPTPAGLVAFHAAIKLTLLAHSPAHYTELGRLVAGAGRTPWPELVARYFGRLMDGLKALATPRKHANVFHHLMGFLKDHLDAGDKAELLAAVQEYRDGLVPHIVPFTLLRHHLAKHPVGDWVRRQTYLNPYPKEMMLRNHV